MIFDQAEELGMPKMDILDLGGGYSLLHPLVENSFITVASQVAPLLDELFPDRSIRIIAEPGTYMVESSCYLASQIIGQKFKKGVHQYYINNGIFQGYLNRLHGEEIHIEALDPKTKSRE